MALRLTVTSTFETQIFAALVPILIHHDAEDEIKPFLIRNSRRDGVAHFALLDAIAAPAVLAHAPNCIVDRNR